MKWRAIENLVEKNGAFLCAADCLDIVHWTNLIWNQQLYIYLELLTPILIVFNFCVYNYCILDGYHSKATRNIFFPFENIVSINFIKFFLVDFISQAHFICGNNLLLCKVTKIPQGHVPFKMMLFFQKVSTYDRKELCRLNHFQMLYVLFSLPSDLGNQQKKSKLVLDSYKS